MSSAVVVVVRPQVRGSLNRCISLGFRLVPDCLLGCGQSSEIVLLARTRDISLSQNERATRPPGGLRA